MCSLESDLPKKIFFNSWCSHQSWIEGEFYSKDLKGHSLCSLPLRLSVLSKITRELLLHRSVYSYEFAFHDNTHIIQYKTHEHSSHKKIVKYKNSKTIKQYKITINISTNKTKSNNNYINITPTYEIQGYCCRCCRL